MKPFQNKEKIIKVSKVLRQVAFAGTVFWGLGILVVLFQIITQTPVVAGFERFSLQGSLLVVLGFRFLVTLFVFRFFDRLQKGQLFDAKTVGQLAAAGKWWIVLWLYEGLQCMIAKEVVNGTGAWDSSGLFTGLTLIFVAWLLKEAQGLQEEQELTV